MPERQVLLTYRDPAHRKPSVVERVKLAAVDLGIQPPSLQEAA